MTIDLDTGKLVVFIVGLVLFLFIEALAPARRWREGRLKRLGFHAGIAIFNIFTVRLLAYVPMLLWLVYADEQGWGLARWLGLYGWAEIIISLIVLDAFDYFWHRANHRVKFLWRFHKAHHSDTEMDVSTALRFHPGELLISALVKASWVMIWGPTAVAWFLFEALVSFCAQFHHSNIDFPDKVEQWLSAVIVTPRYHAAHHAVDRQFGDRNFSTIFSIWDRIFHSYAQPADGGRTTRGEAAIGLPEDRHLAFSTRAWISDPFKRRNLNLKDSSTSDAP